jgi:hypothetical protein
MNVFKQGKLILTGLIAVFVFSGFATPVHAQGIGDILGRLNRIEDRLDKLDILQRKNPGKASENAPGKTEIDIRNKVADLDSSQSIILHRIARLEEALDGIRSNGNSNGDEVETVRELSTDLRGLIGNIRAMMDEKAASEKEKPSLQVKYPASLYGYVKLDLSWDASRINSGNYARWVEAGGSRQGQANITARQTRFGLNFNGPEDRKIVTTGKMEIDFYGGGDENKNAIMMRQAFLKVFWPAADFSVLAGQAADVISPLFPGTINYTVDWWAGNIGYRRPQLRLTKGFKLAENTKLFLELAAVRSIGGDAFGTPGFQGRSSLSFRLLTEKCATFGLSGHSGKEEGDTRSWSANLDVSLPISGKIVLEGECWTGENLDAYLGGIGQGVTTTGSQMKEIKGSGGWAAFALGPLGSWQFNFGTSLDDPDDQDLKSGDRARNASIFGNVTYNLNQAVQIGMEISNWDTRYLGQNGSNGFRYQIAWIYKF